VHDHHLIEVLSWNLLGGTEENHKNISQNSLRTGRDSNRTSDEYNTTALPKSQPVRSLLRIENVEI
jgi:hypothetical protein